MQAVLDEVIEKITQFSDEDRDKLTEVLQKQKNEKYENQSKGYVHPNTLWINENHAEYQGKYVALKDGELIAVGNTIKEVDVQAKEKNIEKPLLTYLFPLDEVPFGDW